MANKYAIIAEANEIVQNYIERLGALKREKLAPKKNGWFKRKKRSK